MAARARMPAQERSFMKVFIRIQTLSDERTIASARPRLGQIARPMYQKRKLKFENRVRVSFVSRNRWR